MRSKPRVVSAIPATLIFANGRTLVCQTRDFSSTGVGLKLPAAVNLTGRKIRIVLTRDRIEIFCRARWSVTKARAACCLTS
ncbi:PilZ domain-containing protein [Roseateles sp. GG27B]